jgi:hypothetical protein
MSAAALALAVVVGGLLVGSGTAAASNTVADSGPVTVLKMPCGQQSNWYNHCARSHIRLYIEDFFGHSKTICIGPGVHNLDNYNLPWTVVYAQVRGVC